MWDYWGVFSILSLSLFSLILLLYITEMCDFFFPIDEQWLNTQIKTLCGWIEGSDWLNMSGQSHTHIHSYASRSLHLCSNYILMHEVALLKRVSQLMQYICSVSCSFLYFSSNARLGEQLKVVCLSSVEVSQRVPAVALLKLLSNWGSEAFIRLLTVSICCAHTHT